MKLQFFLTLSVFLTCIMCQTSAFGGGSASSDYTLQLIKQFTPNSQNDELKCKEIPGLGFPVKIVPRFNIELAKMFDPNDPNYFIKMFFYDDKMDQKDRIYKYGIEVRSFLKTMYIAMSISVAGNGNIKYEDFIVTKDPQLLPVILNATKIDLNNALGCGDLKAFFQSASG